MYKHKKEPELRLLRYFLTERGRKLVCFAAGFTTLSLFAANFIPHTFGLNYYRDFVQCYENGAPREVPEKVQKRLKRALDTLNLQTYERLIIKPFTVFGFDLFQAGSTKYRYGCILGIPINYSYASADEIKRNEILCQQKPIEWDTDSGKLLEEAIVLTEDEQVFGLCKTILQLQTHRVLMNSIFPSVTFLSMYAVGNYMNLRLNLFAGPLSLRLVMYSILGCFGLGSWCFLKDYNQVCYDAAIDKKLSTLGPEFVQAGVSFYDKNLKKNMALRALIGDDAYTAKGNVNYFLRHKSMPLTARKSFFEEKSLQTEETSEMAC